MRDCWWSMVLVNIQTEDGRFVALYPPTIVKSVGQGKTFAVSGETWIEVPDGSTLEDADKLFCWGVEGRKHWDPDYTEEKNQWEITGSKDKKYMVTQNGTSWHCECAGYRFRRDCKHIQNLKILFSA